MCSLIKGVDVGRQGGAGRPLVFSAANCSSGSADNKPGHITQRVRFSTLESSRSLHSVVIERAHCSEGVFQHLGELSERADCSTTGAALDQPENKSQRALKLCSALFEDA